MVVPSIFKQIFMLFKSLGLYINIERERQFFMKKSYVLLHIAVLLAGFTGVFGKLITLNEGLLTWYRVFFSAIFLLLLIKFFSIPIRLGKTEKRKLMGIGVLITGHWLFFYASIKYANISVGVICFSLTCFFTAIFKPLIDRKRIVYSELFFSTIVLFGISLIFHFDTTYQVGIICGVISSAFGSLYTIFNERIAGQYDAKVNNYYQMIGGTIVLGLLLPLYLYVFPTENIFPSWQDTFYLILLATLCTVGLYVAVTEVLKEISAFTVNLSFNLEPLYAIILAFVFYDEGSEVGLSFYIGMACVLLSVVLQTIFSLRKAK